MAKKALPLVRFLSSSSFNNYQSKPEDHLVSTPVWCMSVSGIDFPLYETNYVNVAGGRVEHKENKKKEHKKEEDMRRGLAPALSGTVCHR